MQTSGVAIGAAALAGAGAWRPLLAAPPNPADPKPIPDGSPLIGFHVYGPGFPGLDPADSNPATITDFKGFVGLAYISGMVARTQHSTGEVRHLPFLGADMRFMQGVYRGADGKVRHGAFGFI